MLRLVSNTLTRAAGTNDDRNNEDNLFSADLYFYAVDAAGAAKWHTRVELKASNSTNITDLSIPADAMSAIFGTDTAAKICVVANAPVGLLPTYEGLAEGESLPTADELYAISFTTTWNTSAGSSAQSSFLMYGEAEITKESTSVSGTVNLDRAAAKFELTINSIMSEVTVNNETWTPVIGEDGSALLVSFVNAVNKSYVNSPFVKELGSTDATQKDYHFTPATVTTNNVEKTVYAQAKPFYSYSSNWGTGGASEPYLLLVVKWSKDGGTTSQNTYYQIPVGSIADKQIKRNYYYKISIDVGTLGSFEPQTSTPIKPSYTVIDWSTGQITASIKEARYLVVDETNVEIFNQNEYRIGYASSHPDETTVKILSITRDDMSGNISGTTTFYSGDGVTSVDAGEWDNDEKYKLLKDCTVSLQDGEIVFTHNLVNEDENSSVNADGYPTTGDYRNIDDYDFAPYYITLEVSMAVDENTTFSEQITITQYPQLYAKASPNSDYGNGGGPNDDRNVMVNATTRGYQVDFVYNPNTNQDTFGTVPGLWTSENTNQNPNMYVVTATSFSSDSPYFIGDPRQLENDTDLINATHNKNGSQRSIWVNTVDINGTTRRLQYYYPTNQEIVGNSANDPASYVTGYMVAPKFRVASSYSVTTQVSSLEIAERRCASYQEDGYPAGRWRLPTYAEAAFIVKLSNEEKIPYLFNTGTAYWCAHGQFEPTAQGVTLGHSGATSVRCVYDEWYWGSSQLTNKGTFTWGDQPR